MYKRLSAIMFPILAIMLVGALYWGYQENQEKNSILIKAENSYQRSFHNLSYHLDQLHTELGNALAVNSTSQNFQRKCLVNVWRITSEAQSEINQLPLTLMPFHETEKFLADIANFAYRTAIRDLSKNPITSKEMETLKALYQHSNEISSEIRTVQEKVLSDHLRWMDVEVAMASEDSVRDNTIIDGFKLVDEKVTEYSDVDFGPSAPDIFDSHSMKQLSGEMVDEQEIIKKAVNFLHVPADDLQIVENGKGTEFQSYSVTVNQNDNVLQLDYTKKGGHLVYFINNREVNETKLTPQQAEQKAQQFLQEHEFGQMEPVGYDFYENVASLTFASKKNNVIIYPEKLVVRVALDNGEITGLNASSYVYEKKDRKWNSPKLTEAEAREKLNPELKVTETTMALIEDELDNDRLTYQFMGKLNDSMYRIYIDAFTGEEVKIENIKMAEA